MKAKILFVVLLFPLFAFTCKEKVAGGHKEILFTNNSDDTIYVAERWQIKISFSDTIYKKGLQRIEIGKNESFGFDPLNNYWETDFNVIPFIQYFVFSQRTYNLESYEEWQKYQLKRYLLTKEDLEKMNWRIVYP
jgi:hypothetical protein